MRERKSSPVPTDSLFAVAFVVAIAVGLSYVFWSDLWHGGGLIGGDLYSYFLPQKTFLIDRLRAGEFPLWNNLVGHGYPLVAESQTGSWYPFNLLAYSQLDVNTAYNTVQLVHYVLAFVFAWMYGRRFGLSQTAAMIAALIYTYGWFPPRIALEWAIIGGAWLPLALWCVESHVLAPRIRYLVILAAALSLQMLAGHYNIAFLTQLLLFVYLPCRLWWARGLNTESSDRVKGRRLLVVLATMGVAFGLAAVQLVPSWELKQLSQRSAVGSEHQPGYGNIPAEYLLQMFAPWHYYSGDIDARLREFSSADAPGTNKLEAHLYFGLIAIGLIACGILSGTVFRDRRLLMWAALGILAAVYCTGLMLPITEHLPGFSFFRGPGRYGLMTTMAAAILAGASWDRLTRATAHSTCVVLFVMLFSMLTVDLWYVSQTVRVTEIIADSAIRHRMESPIREVLLVSKQPPRLFCRGANLPTLLGVASTPTYLGIGPDAYFDPALKIPEPIPFGKDISPEQIGWLRRAGVTHVLSFEPLEQTDWPVTQVWQGIDPLVNSAWGRPELLYLYEFHGGRGRLSWKQPQAGDTAEIREYRANRVSSRVVSQNGGTLVLTDLHYPGWMVRIDGERAEPLEIDGMYRGVTVPAGEHTVVWAYEPRSQFVGVIVSLVSLVAGGCAAFFAFRRHRREVGERPA